MLYIMDMQLLYGFLGGIFKVLHIFVLILESFPDQFCSQPTWIWQTAIESTSACKAELERARGFLGGPPTSLFTGSLKSGACSIRTIRDFLRQEIAGLTTETPQFCGEPQMGIGGKISCALMSTSFKTGDLNDQQYRSTEWERQCSAYSSNITKALKH